MKRLNIDANTKYADLPLNYQQCIDNYIQTGSLKESYKIVANSKLNDNSLNSYAYRFFNNPLLKPIIQERRLEILRESQMKPEDIIKRIEDIANGKVEDQYSPKTAVKDMLNAAKLLADINGMTQKNDININNAIAVQFVNDLKE